MFGIESMKMEYGRKDIKKILLILIYVSTLVRIILALTLELTNDEPNYWLYAKFPEISHYEHPPMIGLFVQLTTFNLRFESEFFLRLSSLILGVFNTYMIFVIGKKIKDELTGLYAAFLFTASFYSFIIAGVFIHPDTPLLFFSLIGLYFLVDGFADSNENKLNTSILFAGFPIGLAMLSKYTAIHLLLGTFLFAIFFDRKWLKKKEIYISAIISILCITPVIAWNALNQSNTISFWDKNVPLLQGNFSLNYFLPELAGQIFYNNPVNFFIIIACFIGFKQFQLQNKFKQLLLLLGIPLPLLLLFISLTGKTLPHWSAPGYTPLILLAAAYLSEKSKKFIPLSIKIAGGFAAVIIVLTVLQINYGIFDFTKDVNVNPPELGRHDLSLDMYGWKQAGEKFNLLNKHVVEEGKISFNAPIFSNKWYNSGKVDYYLAHPLGKKVFTKGSDVEIRKYAWVNRERGGFENVTEAYYISPSRDYEDPEKRYYGLFSSITPLDTFRIERSGKIVENMFVFIMKK